MHTVKLSAVIITFNEEKNIERCLDSLIDVVDDIVVVDSFSTDQTPALCAQYKVNFVQRPWLGYAAAKNHANAIAKYDFLLSIDADEALSAELKEAIIKIKSDMRLDAYYISRLTNYCGKWIKHCGWYPEYKIRLWNRTCGEWRGVIHESLIFHNTVRSGTLKGDLLHYSFYSISDHIHTADKFSEIAAEEKVKEGFRVNIIWHLILNPLFTFFQKYILKRGFLDGYYGFVISIISAFSNFLKYAKIKQKSQT